VRIGTIGTGRIGGTLARLLGAAGHEVVVTATRPPQDLAEQVAGWPGVRAGTSADLDDREVVLLAFPWRVAEAALDGIDLRDRIVIDATNPFSEDFDIVDTGERGSTGRVADLLPGARIVKAFNTVPDDQLVDRADDRAPTARRIGIPIATDDAVAAEEVTDLIASLGFTAVPVGGLGAGRDLMEPACPLFNVPLPARELEARVRQLRSD
jgi:8-hydroxy-5-deazaflavin:NADPH oxidoreductase